MPDPETPSISARKMEASIRAHCVGKRLANGVLVIAMAQRTAGSRISSFTQDNKRSRHAQPWGLVPLPALRILWAAASNASSRFFCPEAAINRLAISADSAFTAKLRAESPL